MKKLCYAGISALFVGAIVFICMAVSPDQPQAFAQPASGQEYYDYHSLNTADASGGVAVWTTSTEERFQIHTVIINGPVAMAVQLLDGATEITTYYYGINGGACPIYDLRSAAKGNDLTIKSNAAGQINITVVGTSSWGY